MTQFEMSVAPDRLKNMILRSALANRSPDLVAKAIDIVSRLNSNQPIPLKEVSAADLLIIYQRREKVKANLPLNLTSIGVSELVKRLKSCVDPILLSGYVSIDGDICSFWTTPRSQLVGCIVGRDARVAVQ